MSNVTVLRCCDPIYRDHPSRVRKYHAKSCPVSPGKEIVAVRRAEIAKHAARVDPDVYESDYPLWQDSAYEREVGK